MKENRSILICPVCAEPLYQYERTYACNNNHVFDKSKQSYVNLLLSNQKKSLQPGDNKEMVKSRLDFLKQGYYLPIVEAINTSIGKAIEKSFSESLQIADLGCGVGYYLSALKKQLDPTYTNLSYWGIDISKEAIHSASIYDKSISWLVGSVKNLPFASKSVDICLSVFSPIYNDEVQRILSSKGLAFVITPASQHLLELRKVLFDEIKPIDPTKLLQKIEGSFEIVDSIPIFASIHLQSSNDIENLLKMTPFYWRSNELKKKELFLKKELIVTIDVILRVLRPLQK